MNDRLNTTLFIIGWAVCCCAIGAILSIDLYNRYYERAYNPPDPEELDELRDKASKLIDEAQQLSREVEDDIKEVNVKIDALKEFMPDHPDHHPEWERRIAVIRTEIGDIEKKKNDIEVLIERAEIIHKILELYSP